MTTSSKRFKAAAAVFMSLILTAVFIILPCGAEVSALGISNSSITLMIGQTKQLSVSGASTSIKWSSSNSYVASVSKYGKVTAKNPGSAYVYARVGKKQVKCRVKVVEGSIHASFSSVSLKKGQKTTVTITARGSHAVKVTSSNPSVASAGWVSSSFVNDQNQLRITGRKAGSATIKVYMTKHSHVYTTIYVTVSGSSSSSSSTPSISTNVSSLDVNVGSSNSFVVSSSQGNNIKVTNSNGKVARVSVGSWYNNRATVTVTGLKRGTTTITFKSRTNSKVLKKVTVYVNGGSSGHTTTLSASPTSVSLTPNSQRSVTITSSNPYNLTYSLSNSNIASYSVSNSNNKAYVTITGRQAGTTYLTVNDYANNKSVRITISVSGSTLSVSPTSLNLQMGGSSSISVNTSNGYGVSVSGYSSSVISAYVSNQSSSRATVYVTAVGSGSTNLTISDGTGASRTVSVRVNGSSLSVSPTSLSMNVNDSQSITVTTSNGYNVYTSGYSSSVVSCQVSSQSSNRAIVYVYAQGAGSTSITISDGYGNTKTVPVTVRGGNITVSPSSITLNTNDSRTVTVSGASGYLYASSSNPSVATAYSSGSNSVTVYASSSGSATITVTDSSSSKSAYIYVTVKSSATPIRVSPSTVYMDPADVEYVDVIASDYSRITVSSSNSNVAIASFAGGALYITSGEAGNCTITLYDSASGTSATVSVNVRSSNNGYDYGFGY